MVRQEWGNIGVGPVAAGVATGDEPDDAIVGVRVDTLSEWAGKDPEMGARLQTSPKSAHLMNNY